MQKQIDKVVDYTAMELISFFDFNAKFALSQ